MSSIRNMAIVGCGAIGSSLAVIMGREFKATVKVTGLFDTDRSKSLALSKRICGTGRLSRATLQQTVAGADFVVEAASSAGSWEIAKKAIAAGCDVLIMSVGGVLEHGAELEKLAASKKVSVYIPSGAVAGIDSLRGCRGTSIRSVMLTTRKPPKSFKGNQYLASRGIDLDRIRKETVIFSGSAREAVKRFPQNVNVAAVISLAGVGPAKTKVRIIADPKVGNNNHEVTVVSGAGRVVCRTENVLHPDNPKTSYLAVLSAVATVRQAVSPVKIG